MVGVTRGRGGLAVVRDFVLLSGGELFTKVIAFVAFAFLARTIEPAAYGAVELAVSLSLFFAMVVDFGLSPLGAREVARDAGRIEDLAAEIPFARLVVGVLAIPVMCVIPVLLGQPPQDRQLVWLFAIGLLGVPFRQQWLYQGLERMHWVSLALILRTAVFTAGVMLVVDGADDLLLVGAAELAAALVLAVYFVRIQGRLVTPFRFAWNLAGSRRLLWEGSFIGLSETIWALNQYLPILLIAGLVGSVEVAFFGAVHRIVMSLATFGFVYHFNFFPTVARSLAVSEASYRGLVGPSFKATAWGGIGLALAVTLLADPICRLIYGEAFVDAGATLAVLVWTIPLTLFSGHARWALIARGEQRSVALAQLAGAVATLSVGAWGTLRWGALGGAAGMVSSAAVVWFVAHACARRTVRHIPFLGAVARPALAALVVGVVVRQVDGAAWGTATGGVLAFAALGPLLDRRLVTDLRSLARARDAGPDPAVPGNDAEGAG